MNRKLLKSQVRNLKPRTLSAKERLEFGLSDTVYIGTSSAGGQNYYALYALGKGLIPLTRSRTRQGSLASFRPSIQRKPYEQRPQKKH